MQQLDQHTVAKLERDVSALKSVSNENFFLEIQKLMEWFVRNPNLQGILKKLAKDGERESKEYINTKNDLKEHLLSTIQYYRKLRRDNDKIRANEEVYEELKAARQCLIAEDLYSVSYEEGLHCTIQQALDRLNSLGIPVDKTITKAFYEEWKDNIEDWDKNKQSLERFDRYISPIISFIKEKVEKDERAEKDDLLNDLYEDLDAYYPKNLMKGHDFDLTLGCLERVGELLKDMQIEVDTEFMNNLDQKYEDLVHCRRIFEKRGRVSPFNAFLMLSLTLRLHSNWNRTDFMTAHAAMHEVGKMELTIDKKGELTPDRRQEYLTYLDTLVRFVKDNLETRNAILEILQKFKRRCEWYSYGELLDMCKESQRETLITIKTLVYLYDNGLLPLYKPMIGNKQPDAVELENALVLEIKVTEGKRTEIVKGFNQAFDYASSYNVGTGYYLIFNYSGSSLDIPSIVSFQDKEIHIITINLHENPPSKEKKLRVIRITEDDLLSSED